MSIPFLDLSPMHAELEAELDDAWRLVSRSSKFIGGEFVDRFEEEWAAYCGTAHCVGLASGTAALQLGLSALGIGPGDEIILPANTFFATAEAVIAVGAKPVFVDVDPSTLLMTAAAVENAITPRTAAVIAVHLYGQPVDMDAVGEVAGAAGLAVIEDAAQAHGSTWLGRRAGSLSHVGCFSFYPGKNLGAFGDAGAVVTNDRGLAERIRSLSNHGRARDDHCRHEYLGGTHRLDALQAAILSVKLRRLDAWNDGRRRVAAWYEPLLRELAVEPVHMAAGARSNHHLAVIQTPHRDHIRERLRAEGIATGIHYPTACHRQPALGSTNAPCLPVAERAAKRVLSLPMAPHLTQSEVARVAEAIGRALAALDVAHESQS
ncbi:DegT/DnrJ/EryC1/StrS family aminotransferase [Inquilinus limosus]|uniref:DegT/DnrJ/EryC1/StrS family aminotransferase n=1 Tax=Inquilinus limosus TaxID=171674 RepID=UPI003F14F43D